MVKKTKQEKLNEPAQSKRLRIWPAVLIIVLQWLVRLIIPIIEPEAAGLGVLVGVFGWLAIVVWWAFFSRAPRFDRWSGVIVLIITLVATWFALHASMRLLPFIAYIIPTQSLAFVGGTVASQHLSDRPRHAVVVATILIACGVWTLIRTGGITHDFQSDLAWRWSETSEERFLAQIHNQAVLLPSNQTAADTEIDWPGFRGPNRDSIIHNVKIETDWSVSPPVELWRRMVGPGWSSFAVGGDHLYTQEQHGDYEVVACYSLTTGEPIWIHRDQVRFWESNSGPGPRGTPTLSDGRVFALGGTGILNALDAGNGSVVWSRDAAADTDTNVSIWGFSGSPLVNDDAVIVALAGSLIAYDKVTGDMLWSRPTSGDCYSSPHLLHIDGIEQILLQNEAGMISVTPAGGKLLWEYAWPGVAIVQPALIADGDILISTDETSGMRRISVSLSTSGWTVKECWSTTQIKPYFNDSVVHGAHVYGFYGSSLVCVDIEDGARKWKGGRYGRGQFILLADQDLLLVLSERGELALVKAIPDQFMELARVQAIEGKTWNHPVLVGNILVVRNAQEMAAFRITRTDKSSNNGGE